MLGAWVLHIRKQEEADPEEELNRILEKIRKQGMGSLTKKEKRDLKKFSD